MQKTQNGQNNFLKGRAKLNELYVLDFNISDDIAVLKSMWYGIKHRQIDQNNRIYIPETHSLIYVQLNFYRNTTAVEQGKKSLFQ